MYAKRLLSIASALVLLGCGETTPTALAGLETGLPLTPPSMAELTGVVVVTGRDDGGSVFLQIQGELIPLAGSEASRLERLDGAEVMVRGTWDADPGLVVESFVVLAVRGRPALDGVLVNTDDGYALLLRDGTYHALVDPPAELLEHVGSRVWLTGALDELPIEFGVLEQS